MLVVEDEVYVRDSLSEILRERGYDIVEAGTVGEAVRVLAHAPSTSCSPTSASPRGRPGPREADPGQLARGAGGGAHGPGHDRVRGRVPEERGQRLPAQAADPEALEVALERAQAGRALRREVQYLRAAGREVEPLGESPAWKRALEMIDAAAASDSVVLLRGESGTGKDLLARRLHQKSRRAAGPYIRVNGAAVPLEQWESEFFGHRRGSFHGASADREGGSSSRIGARCSWTRWGPCRRRPSPSSCARSRTASSTAWASSSRRAWTCASWPPPTPTSNPTSRTAASA